MLLLAKITLGLTSSLALTTAYSFHEGVIRIDVDESRESGSHVHFWVPATAAPLAMHFIPKSKLESVAANVGPYAPALHILFRELEKYPDADLIEIKNEDQHIQLRTENGKFRIDVDSPDETVHVLCPAVTLRQIFSELEDHAPSQ